MSDFHETLNEVLSQGTETIPSEVKVSLRKLGSLFDDEISKVKVFGSENKDKRLANDKLAKENRELTAQVTSLEAQVSSLDESPLKAEVAKLKAKEQKWTDGARNNLQKKLEVLSKHTNWDKAKSFLDVSQSDDGKIDLTGLDPDSITNMSDSLVKVEKLGLFEGSGTPPSPTFGKGTPKVQPNGEQPDDLSDREQVSKFVSQELQKAL